MRTEHLWANDPEHVRRAAEILRNGGLVAFATETVYGLGADAFSATAVASIFEAKGRPSWDPLIVHADGLGMVKQVASLTGLSRDLAERYWPGPLTLLLPRSAEVPDAVTAGRQLVGVRVPRHQTARELIRLARVPIAAPSANLFGHTSPTTAQHVLDDLDGRIDAVLDGGATEVGVESTVAEVVSQDEIVVYRAGGVDLHGFDSTIRIRLPKEDTSSGNLPQSLASPGLGMRHYAPRARLVLVGRSWEGELARLRSSAEKGVIEAIDDALREGSVGVMLPEGWERGAASEVFAWGPWEDAEMLARRLFAGLRALDECGVTVIVCPMPEMNGLGEALRDRLGKAARLR